MKTFLKGLRSYLFSILAWLIPAAILALLVDANPDGMVRMVRKAGNLPAYILAVAAALGIFHQLSNQLTDLPAIRRSSLITILLLRAAVMAVLVFGWEAVNIAQFFTPDAELAGRSAVRLLGSGSFYRDLGYVLMVDTMFSWLYQLRTVVGRRRFHRLLLGIYRKPRTEKRIFMFIDMKDSTTHAEKLGHLRFSRLVQECFKDFDIISLRRDVDIYQYVGDEVIVSWDIASGLRNLNALKLFFEFKKLLVEREDYYREEFDLVPVFKAGVHLGDVTVAEIGVTKRGIEYLSDVLNTAARIQGVCNQYSADFLVSGDLMSMYGETPGFASEFLETVQLKGKTEHVDVYRVTPED